MWSAKPGLRGRDVVRERAVRPLVAVVGLLAQHGGSASPSLEHDVVALGLRRPEAVDAARLEELAGDDLVQQLVRVARRARAPPRPSRGRRGSSGTCPSAPTRGRRTASRCSRAASARAGSTVRVPVNGGSGRSSARHSTGVRFARAASSGEERLARLLAVELAQPLLVGRASPRRGRRAARARAALETTPTTREASSTCSVGCEYAGAIRTAVCCFDVVAPPIRSGRSSPRRSISCGDVDHLVERRRDQPREPDDVAALLVGRVEDPVGRDHDAEVDDLVVVAAEDDPDDVLADVVDVALHGREHDLPLRAAARPRPPSRPPCTARGRRRRASSPARSSRPAGGTSGRSRRGRRRSPSRP